MGAFLFKREKCRVQIPDTLIDLALDKAAEMAEHHHRYVLDGAASRKSIDDLVWIVTTYLLKDVSILEIDIPADTGSIRAFMVRYPLRYDIVMLAEKNFCLKRFVLCKELFQVILDDDRFHNVDIYKQMEESALAMMDVKSSPSMNVISEALAEIATIEFLFPYADRIAITRSLAPGQEADSSAIAERYKIPKLWVERALSAPVMAFYGAHFERRARQRG